MEIKIIGSNCSNGMKLFKMASRAADNAEEEVNLKKLDDKESIKKYGVRDVPGLVINEKLVSQGKVLTEREILKLLY